MDFVRLRWMTYCAGRSENDDTSPVRHRHRTADGLRIEPNEPPPITPPTPGTGVQAKRIADLIELFGVNTFSSLDEHNIWGSWPADYQPASCGSRRWCYIVGDSGPRCASRSITTRVDTRCT